MSQPIFIVGPTCVGKSAVAIKLSQNIPLTSILSPVGRGDINAEIVSCDSMQVYRGMDIGTAKPSGEEQKIVPHHLIDIIDLTKEYNVAQYVKDANKVIQEIQKRNKIPLIVGGTGLYVKVLIDGLFTGPGASESIRKKLEERIEKEGLESLHNELKKIDPASFNKIKQKDKRRIIRALEVYYIVGKPISSFQTQWPLTPTLSPVGRGELIKGSVIIGLNRDRKDLYCRIDDRVEGMFKDGLVDEVKELVKKGLAVNKTASHALGYKEVLGYLSGLYTLQEMKELIKRNTRRFAKRQLTWFKKDDRVKWILVGADEDVSITVERILNIFNSRKFAF